MPNVASRIRWRSCFASSAITSTRCRKYNVRTAQGQDRVSDRSGRFVFSFKPRSATWPSQALVGSRMSQSRRSGSGSCCRSAYTFWDTWATPDVPFCAAADRRNSSFWRFVWCTNAGCRIESAALPFRRLADSARRVIGSDLRPNLELAPLQRPTISEANPDRNYIVGFLSEK